MNEDESRRHLSNENVASYIASTDNFVNSFITNIIKSPTFLLRAQEYHFEVTFSEEGEAGLQGVFWPECLQKLNISEVDGTEVEEIKTIKEEYLRNIKSSIATTGDIQVLKNQFNLSDKDCEKIQSVVINQTHMCRDCPTCLDPPLPSLETMLAVTPDEEENILASARFSDLFKTKFLLLSTAYIQDNTTFGWIETISNEIEESEIVDPNCWNIILGGEVFKFIIDERLSNLLEEYDYCPLLALYHYSISCVSKPDECRIILSRPHLSDVYLKPFNPFISKAASGPINIQILNSTRDWNNLTWSRPITHVRSENRLIDHQEFSLTEALVLLDNNKLNNKSSSAVEFVWTGPDYKLSFKKTKDPSANSFTLENNLEDHYERLETVVSRFLRRLNGKELLLCEVATKYEFVGSTKSEELFEVYKNKLHQISDTEDTCVTGKALYPELILCDFGDFGHVLKIRKRMKVLNHSHFNQDSFEHKHSQVLLYYHVQDDRDLVKEVVEESYNAVTDGEERVIDRNRKKFLHIART